MNILKYLDKAHCILVTILVARIHRLGEHALTLDKCTLLIYCFLSCYCAHVLLYFSVVTHPSMFGTPYQKSYRIQILSARVWHRVQCELLSIFPKHIAIEYLTKGHIH